MRTLIGISFVLLHFCSFSQVFDSTLWVPNGPVHTINKNADKIYIGGEFTYWGSVSGHGVILDTSDASFPIKNFPKINGPVYAIASDGWDGWYIGGDFTQVGDFPIKNLVRISNKGAIVKSFTPNPNGPVYAIFAEPINTNKGKSQNEDSLSSSRNLEILTRQNGHSLYIGGNFTNVGGKARMNVAAINRYSGYVEDRWSPQIDGPVYCISYWGQVKHPKFERCLIFGGDFQNVDGIPCPNLTFVERVFPDTNSKVYYFDFKINGPVKAVYTDYRKKGTLIIGGEFSKILNTYQPYLARVDSINYNKLHLVAWNNSKPSGSVLCFSKPAISKLKMDRNPNLQQLDSLMKYKNFTDSTILIGGNFTSINGKNNYKYISELNIDNGNVYNRNFNINGTINSLNFTEKDKRIFIGGKFTSIDSAAHRYGALLDSNGKAISSFNPSFSNPVNAICVSDSLVYYGGDFICMNGEERFNFAELDSNNRTLTSWNPKFDSAVNGLSISRMPPDLSGNSTFLYLFGDFSKIDTSSRKKIACIDLNTKAITKYNPYTDGKICDQIIDSTRQRIYYAGKFNYLDTKTRSNLACYDLLTQTTTDWAPEPNGIINDIEYCNGNIFAAGYYNKIKTTFIQNNLTKLDTLKGYPDMNWNAQTDAPVYSIFENNGNVFLGGWFNDVAGNFCNYSASLDTTTGAFTNFLSTNGPILKMQKEQNKVLISGDFTSVNSLIRNYFILYDLNTLSLDLHNPSFDDAPKGFSMHGNALYTGGLFHYIENDYHPYFVKLNTNAIASINHSTISTFQLFAYPIPISKELHLKIQTTNNNKNVLVKIFDIHGKLLMEKYFNSILEINQNVFSTALFSNGLYLIQVIIENETKSIKVLKQE